MSSDSSTGEPSLSFSPKIPGIEDYGLIGDMHTCALVGWNGSIDYMCWPQFDSPSIFCRILDTTKGEGGHWSVKPGIKTITKQHYLASTNILRTKWIHEDGVVRLTDFFAVSAKAKSKDKSQHKPLLIRRLECARGSMPINMEFSAQPDYGRQAPGTYEIETVPTSGEALYETITAAQQSEFPHPSISILAAGLLGKVSHNTSGKGDINGANGTVKCNQINTTFTLKEGSTVFMVLSDEPIEVERLARLEAKCEAETSTYWKTWVRKCSYRGRFQQEVERSMLVLKLLTYKPTGAIIAAPTFSLPESIGGVRNWDYRYSWVRDSSFTVYVFLKMGFTEEAEAYINFIFDRIDEWHKKQGRGKPSDLPLMFSIDGESDLPELELNHLGGYKDSTPVRIGNAATGHVQLDIYGELMDAVYLFNKHGKPITYDQWIQIRHLIDYVSTIWSDADMSIWEVRGRKENFVYSKMLLWVAFDRALRLSDKRCLPCPQRRRWLEIRDTIYEEVMDRGYNQALSSFIQSYESNEMLDAAVLIAPLVFFISPSDPRFLHTLDNVLKSPEKGGLTSAGLVFRYNHTKSNDGVGGREGTFVMCTLWLIEALVRAGQYESKYLDKATTMFETVSTFSNHLGMFSEEIAISGEQLGNTPQAFSHLAFVSAAMNLTRAVDSRHR